MVTYQPFYHCWRIQPILSSSTFLIWLVQWMDRFYSPVRHVELAFHVFLCCIPKHYSAFGLPSGAKSPPPLSLDEHRVPNLLGAHSRSSQSSHPVQVSPESSRRYIRTLLILLSTSATTFKHNSSPFQCRLFKQTRLFSQGVIHHNHRKAYEQYPFIKHLWTTNWSNPFFLPS